ncbi:MAG: LysM peptidoglycan-binding domain-containing protein [Lachnospiraceae bacterium]|nr:LysM peptidoglycan-binding domain-containing protein [Lachnospiraceae bacterium]
MERVLRFIHYNFKLFIIGLCVLFVLGIGALSTLDAGGKASASTSNQKYFICIEISEGDTLWSIADTYISEEYSSVDEYVKEVKELNDLSSDKIFCGATLVVPYFAP